MVPWVGLQSEIVEFPGHTNFIYEPSSRVKTENNLGLKVIKLFHAQFN